MSEYLIHHGVKGMKWGVRRYQNPDGSLTSAGKKRLKKTIKQQSGFYSKNITKVRDQLIAEKKKDKALQSLLNEQDNLITKMVKLDKDMSYMDAKTTEEDIRNQKLYESKWGPLYEKARANEKEIQKIEKQYAKKYVSAFNQARLNDVDYKGSYEKGVEYLESVRKDFVDRGDGVIAENNVFGKMIDYDWDEKRSRLHNYS